PDEGRFRIDGAVMVEDGVHADYREIWRREPESEGPCAAFRLEPSGGLLVISGDCFMEIEDRTLPLPEGETLADIVRADLAAGRRGAAEAHLSLRVCYGRIAGGGQAWEIVLSALPWLEGQALVGSATSHDIAAERLETRFQGRQLSWTLLDASV